MYELPNTLTCVTAESSSSHKEPSNRSHCSRHVFIFAVQAWALLELREGNTDRAEGVVQIGHERCPPHAPLLTAWAIMEARCLLVGLC